ncbi:glycosyltransferase [Paracoccus aerodenitrificans]|uniref:glycosyltransferase family protein n=1 Tax=Paracoccus aerodenitrificans TaxID=3017781 RepID=UPI0022F10FAC|nr:glycosyltransferase [Paracoccus aerodenitrificans]WBU63771.1 glycosyltransferase [Paracoccus aerodenitrificans]
MVSPVGRVVHIRRGGWSGRVTSVLGGVILGDARDEMNRQRDLTVIAVAHDRVVARAIARPAEGGRFVMVLPPDITGTGRRTGLTLGIAGSDHVLDAGRITFSPAEAFAGIRPAYDRSLDLAIRIKIAAPEIREAQQWGDYHYAISLAAALERNGARAVVDTADKWYIQPSDEDVVLVLRGRQPVKLSPRAINIMWMISHPDRVKPDEYSRYDHVYIASDIFSSKLADQGLGNLSCLHQATDATVFRRDARVRKRLQRGLFLGSSRREYRTMVKWGLSSKLPFDLYGGGWEGVVPPQILRASYVRNADLPDLYSRYALLLNDHWETMRESGFLSNRLFDGSAVASPILTDNVAGLSEVFGDNIAVASDASDFRTKFADCLAEPQFWQERAKRAQEIVHNAHTMDHRAAEMLHMIRRIMARRRL